MPETTRQTTIRDFLSVVFRRKWIILGLFVVTTGTVLFVNLSSPVYYESTARVLVQRGERQGIFEPGYKLLPREEDIASEVELVRSEPVIKNAQRLLDQRRAAARRPRLTLNGGNVYGAVVGESNVIEVNYQDRDPRIVQEAANAITDAYVAFHEQIRSLPEVDTFFTRELTRTRQQLAYWQQARTSFMEASGVFATDAERGMLLRNLEDQRLILADQDREIAAATRKYRGTLVLGQGAQGIDVPFTSNVTVGNEAVIAELKKQLGAAQMELTDASSRYAATAEPVVTARAKVARLQEMLKSEVSNRVRLLGEDLSVLRAKRTSTLSAMSQMETRLKEYPVRAQSIEDMDRIIATLSASEKELQEKMLQAQINKASTMPSFEVTKLTSASWPRAKNTKDYVRLALAPILALAVGLGLAFFVESLDHSLSSAAAVEDGLGVPLLASVREVR